jgi:hypothetical protein
MYFVNAIEKFKIIVKISLLETYTNENTYYVKSKTNNLV